MDDHWEHRCIISGIGISQVGRRTGRSGLELTVEAAHEAIQDAGLTPDDIDGVTTVGETPLAEAVPVLGLNPAWTGEGGSPVGGSMAGVHNACRAAASGLARHVLVYRSVAMLGGSVMGSDMPRVTQDEAGTGPRVMGDLNELLTAHAYSAANWVGMHAQRHTHRYGTTREQMGWVAVNARRHAALNPRAIYREPLTIDDYLAARMISDPIGLYDCDVPVDAACAFVVSDAATAPDLPQLAVRVLAAARASDPINGWFRRTDYPRMASGDAAEELWSRAELGPRDLDFAELYDGFSFLTLAWLEALGICGEGESGPFVEGGQRIGLDGELPLNTYGGQLSAGRLHGHWVMHEACLQLRGEGGPRQVPKHDVTVVSTGGGPFASCMLLTT